MDLKEKLTAIKKNIEAFKSYQTKEAIERYKMNRKLINNMPLEYDMPSSIMMELRELNKSILNEKLSSLTDED